MGFGAHLAADAEDCVEWAAYYVDEFGECFERAGVVADFVGGVLEGVVPDCDCCGMLGRRRLV